MVSTVIKPDVAAKKVSFVLTAGDDVLPEVPTGCPTPPIRNELAKWFRVPKSATTPVRIISFASVTVAILNVFVPEPDKIRLLKLVELEPPMILRGSIKSYGAARVVKGCTIVGPIAGNVVGKCACRKGCA